MWKRAWEDSLSFFGWNIGTLVVPLALWLFGAFIYYVWQGVEAVLEEIAVAISFGLIPICIFLIFLYLFHLIRAPVYMKWEKEKQPRLSVSDTYEEEPFGTHGGRIGIIIRNEGTDMLNGCHARLISLDFETPNSRLTLNRIPTNRDIPCDVNIAGLSDGRVQVMVWHGIMNEEKTEIEYSDGTSNWVPVFWNQPIILLLHIWGDNNKPIYVVCKVTNRTGWGFDLSVLKFGSLQNDIKLSDFQIINPDTANSQTE